MQADPNAALALLPAAAAIGLWVACSDLKVMKIPNKAVIAVALAFAVIGLIVLPLETYLWRWAHLAVVLAIGFVMNMARALGAGDAKYAAAMAPYIALSDLSRFFMLFCAALLVAFVLHRLLRAIPAIRHMAPDWVSWTSAKFPMGLALGPVLPIYLAIAAWS